MLRVSLVLTHRVDLVLLVGAARLLGLLLVYVEVLVEGQGVAWSLEATESEAVEVSLKYRLEISQVC